VKEKSERKKCCKNMIEVV